MKVNLFLIHESVSATNNNLASPQKFFPYMVTSNINGQKQKINDQSILPIFG